MTLEIPETISRLPPNEPAQRMRSVVEGVVLGAYMSGGITRGRACELLGLNYWDGESFFPSAAFLRITIWASFNATWETDLWPWRCRTLLPCITSF